MAVSLATLPDILSSQVALKSLGCMEPVNVAKMVVLCLALVSYGNDVGRHEAKDEDDKTRDEREYL